jgi:hypothetical protein
MIQSAAGVVVIEKEREKADMTQSREREKVVHHWN